VRVGALLALAAVALLALSQVVGGADEPRAQGSGGPAPALAPVERGPLSSQVYQQGTLGFAARPDGSPLQVVNQAQGTLTALPDRGDVVDCGDVLYRVAGDPVRLLCGRVPAYRDLTYGMTGADVRQLNRALDVDSDTFDADTAEALGDDTLELGEAVFLPGPLRISRVSATLGTAARPGAPIAEATTTARRVQVELDASQAAAVERGQRAEITLPDNRTTPGVVTRVGTVAAAQGEEEDAAATVPVTVRLRRPRAVRGLDEAPVQVSITTAGVEDALSVPVTALVAVAGGGFAVENEARALVPVELGLFDHAAGRVQVSGRGLTAGQRVVVPAP
jgi:hypothetical protein